MYYYLRFRIRQKTIRGLGFALVYFFLSVNRSVEGRVPMPLQEFLPDTMTHEVRHEIMHLELEGYIRNSDKTPFALTVTSREAPLRPHYRVFGKSGNPASPENVQLVRLSLQVSGKRMDVPNATLRGIYNPRIGESMSILHTEAGDVAVIMNGPLGEPTYAAALIFRNGVFWRRQVQGLPAMLNKPVIKLDDSIYTKQ